MLFLGRSTPLISEDRRFTTLKMSPECNVIWFFIDNSEWMRNADYDPTRFHSLYDAVNVLINGKSRANVETTFGLLSLTGFELLSSLTTDVNKILQRTHSAPIRGSIDFVKGLKIAELVLEQRENKRSDKRVVAFVGSPFVADVDELADLAIKFLDNKVFVDIILFGEENTSEHRSIQNFIEILNAFEAPESHLLVVPPGNSIAKLIRMSQIMPESQRADSSQFDLDFDIEADPDLAEAIRLSMQDVDMFRAPTKQPMEIDFADQKNEIKVITTEMSAEDELEWALRMSMEEANCPSEKDIKAIIFFNYH
ncbi:hypothetical protein MXB_4448 [Myxobolus squamalis]|nr:hypothetical protein MXB_4448 [Myxobolus squamalis]